VDDGPASGWSGVECDIDEYAEKDRLHFGPTDTNNDGQVDPGELGAATRRLQGAKPK